MDFIFQFFAQMQEKTENSAEAMADQYSASASDKSATEADMANLNIFRYVNFH